MMNILMGKWRRKNNIPKVKEFKHYTEQNGRKVLTFYPVSPIFMPQDPKWGAHIHVIGYWYHPEPLYIRKKLCSTEEIKRALEELVSGKYDMRARELSETIKKENGIEEAIHAIEEYVHSGHNTSSGCFGMKIG